MAYLRPNDAGIIATFKQHYRRKQLEWVFRKIKRREKIDKNAYIVDQRQAMEWSEAIWEDMRKTQTMHNCFRHTGVIFNGVDERSSCSYGDDVKVDEVILRTSQFHLSSEGSSELVLDDSSTDADSSNAPESSFDDSPEGSGVLDAPFDEPIDSSSKPGMNAPSYTSSVLSMQTDMLTTCKFCWKLTPVTHQEKRRANNEMSYMDIADHDSETSCPQISLADYVERRMVNLSVDDGEDNGEDNGEGSSERSGEDNSSTDSGKDSGEDNGEDGEDGRVDNDQDDSETDSEGDRAQPVPESRGNCAERAL
ncbi:unnamed protein product [Phytophthora fragariaefolia]|uniref:Unnamed protein product n=1 Tax=Phytophthora fragariaefolia TaxID=1490495 RepID=A0A9W6YPU6_9STRA|nr:unnamed protein product [Phytophthora fragariaefolia]